MSYPDNYRYSKDHEWAKMDGKTVTVGITDHAQGELGDVVFVDITKKGQTVKQGESIGVVESIKAVSDLYAPVSGKITEYNEQLGQSPGLVNQDPHKAGWIVKIELSDPATFDRLMDASTYEKQIKS